MNHRISPRLVVAWLLLLAPATIMAQGNLPAGAVPPLPIPLAPPIGYPPAGRSGDYGIANGGTSGPALFKYDTAFHLGVISAAYEATKLQKDTLHFDFVYTYKGPFSMHQVMDPALWSTDPGARFNDSMGRQFFRGVIANDWRVVYSPGYISGIAITNSNNYWLHDEHFIHTGYFGELPDASLGIQSEAIPFHGVSGGKFGTYGSPVMMAGKSSFTRLGIYQDDAARHALLHDSTGRTFDDSTHLYDVEVTMRADSLDRTTNPVFDNDVIAYIVLSRRDTTAQTPTAGIPPCKCGFWVPFDTIRITKGLYYNPRFIDSLAGGDYREIRQLFQRPAQTVKVAPRGLVLSGTWRDTSETGVVATYTLDSARYFRAGDTVRSYVPPDNMVFDYNYDAVRNRYTRFCGVLFDSLKQWGIVDGSIANRDSITPSVPNSEIIYDVWTTGLVPITFLRGRVSPHGYTQLRQGSYDSLIYKSIDPIYQDDSLGVANHAINRYLLRVGIRDEITLGGHDSWRVLASRIQDRIHHWDSIDTRGLWMNPIDDYSSARVITGDIDSTRYRMLHMMAAEAYNVAGPFPVRYANPDMMKYSESLQRFYHPQFDIAFNTDSAHTFYARQSLDYCNHQIGKVTELIDVARYRFRQYTSNTFPAYEVVQVHGFFTEGGSRYNFQYRNPTPEEITVQPWLSLNCGVDGLVFSDFADNGSEFGIIHYLTGRDTVEYDTISERTPFPRPPLPKMWLGHRTRFDAVQRINDTLVYTILPVYRLLNRNVTRMRVEDDNAHFRDMVLLDTLYTIRARRFKSGGGYVDSSLVDPKAETYIEATVFNPGPYDPHKSTRYLLLTNKRLWPLDSLSYSSYVDSLDYAFNGKHNTTKGFGPIDVRRPVIKLKNDLHDILGEYEIQKVGWDTNTWQRVPVDSTVELDWLEPGWGEMYRIRPAGGVSILGTAFNNAVRSENLSVDAHPKNRLIVYERDSTIWLRVLDSLGNVSAERMISDSADTVRVSGSSPRARTANNMFPALATVRDGSAVMVVWERETGGQAMVEACYLPTRPDFGPLPAKSRVRLSMPRTTVTTHLTPSITGLDTGWVVAWASPPGGVEAVAIRDLVTPSLASNVSAISRIKAKGTDMVPPAIWTDSLASFPSLAHVRSYYSKGGNGYAAVNMAFQQSAYTGQSRIFYKVLGVRWPSGGQPVIDVSQTVEDVCAGIPSCAFSHPSIAVDSLLLAVTFETRYDMLRGMLSPNAPGSGNTPIVTLRFRNILPFGFPWRSMPVYYFGDSTGFHQYPSVTHFPSTTMADDTLAPGGGLTWMRTVNRTGTMQQWMYHYGDSNIIRLPDGSFPTMTLAPYISATPFKSTSVMSKSADVMRIAGTRPLGAPQAWYYPAVLVNGPGSPDSNFDRPSVRRGRIMGHWTMGRYNNGTPLCPQLSSYTGGIIAIQNQVHPPDSSLLHHDVGFPLPPRDSLILGKRLDSARRLWPTTKFVNFKGGNYPLKIRVYLVAGDSLLPWLNSSPYDSVMGSPADIKTVLELIRVSDSAVRWHSGLISARYIGAGVLDTTITVPVDTAVSPGTQVYIQLRGIPTAGLDYESSVGIQFLYDSTTDEAGAAKPTWRQENHTASMAPQSGLQVMVIPNPAREQAEIRVRALSPGMATITITDLLGRVVHMLPAAEIERAGEYSMPLDLTGLGRGTYIVQARIGDDRGFTRMVIMR